MKGESENFNTGLVLTAESISTMGKDFLWFFYGFTGICTVSTLFGTAEKPWDEL